MTILICVNANYFFNSPDIKAVESTINSLVNVSLAQNQFDALTSLIFNFGSENFKRSNGLSKLNNGDYAGTAHEFFSKERGIVEVNGKFSQGLYNRRKAEEELWHS